MIRGYFNVVRYERPLPRIEIDLSLPRISPFPATIDFLIDTGATSSTIHPGDMLARFRLTRGELTSTDRWPRHKMGLGVGGRVLDYIELARLRFQRENGTVLTLEQDILIAQLTSDNEELPSLLGWDVLRHFRVTLDARTGLVTLEE
jgi:predicted aspartyl protease